MEVLGNMGRESDIFHVEANHSKHSEAVKKSNQVDFLIRMRLCRILIRKSTIAPLRSPTSNYKTRYLRIPLGVYEKTLKRAFSHTVSLVRFFHSLFVPDITAVKQLYSTND